MKKMYVLTSFVIFLSGCKFSDLNFFYNSSNTKLSTTNSYEVSGLTSGYGTLKSDGLADFGLVLRGLQKKDLFQIKLDDLMSSKIDKISVIGSDIELPSNVALPQQRERYILSINLNKPQYSLAINSNLPQQSLVLLHGQFPFEDVVDGFRNGDPLLKLADKFNILSYSEYNFENSSGVQSLALNLVAGQKKHLEQITIKSPATFASDYNFIVLGLNKLGTDYLINNLGVLKPSMNQIFKTGTKQSEILSGLVHESFADPDSTNIQKYKMSLQVRPSNRWTNNLLNFIEDLNYSKSQLSYKITKSTIPVQELGYGYSIYEVSSNDLILTETKVGSWPVSINLSAFEKLRRSNQTYRIDFYLYANEGSKVPQDEIELLELTDLVTRNSLTF